MKIAFWLPMVCLIAVGASIARAQQQQPNLIADGPGKYQWSGSAQEGGQGDSTWIKDNPPWKVRMDSTSDSGYIVFYNTKSLPLTPGQTYEVSAHVRVLQGAHAYLMVAMPGGKRTPFPVSDPIEGADEDGTLKLRFTAQPDEMQLRIHLVVKNKGQALVEWIRLEKVEATDNKSTLWGAGGASLRTWSSRYSFGSHQTQGDTIAADLAELGGFGQDDLLWDASKVKAVEIGWRAMEEPGYLTLQWTSRDGEVTRSGEVSTEYVPDGQWHSLLFDVSNQPQWKGTIRSIWLIVHSNRNPAPMELGYVHALPEVNLVPNADRKLSIAGDKKKIQPADGFASRMAPGALTLI